MTDHHTDCWEMQADDEAVFERVQAQLAQERIRKRELMMRLFEGEDLMDVDESQQDHSMQSKVSHNDVGAQEEQKKNSIIEAQIQTQWLPLRQE